MAFALIKRDAVVFSWPTTAKPRPSLTRQQLSPEIAAASNRGMQKLGYV
jgi:hypothetical protein